MENKPLNIAIGADHAGFELKEKIKGYLSSSDIPVLTTGLFLLSAQTIPIIFTRWLRPYLPGITITALSCVAAATGSA